MADMNFRKTANEKKGNFTPANQTNIPGTNKPAVNIHAPNGQGKVKSSGN